MSNIEHLPSHDSFSEAPGVYYKSWVKPRNLPRRPSQPSLTLLHCQSSHAKANLSKGTHTGSRERPASASLSTFSERLRILTPERKQDVVPVEKGKPGVVETKRDETESIASQHLTILRGLLEKDYLTSSDFQGSLRDVAAMVRDSLDAQKAFVALWEPDTQQWTAITSRGLSLGDEEISAWGSRSVLELVRTSGESVCTTTSQSLDSLGLASASLNKIQVCGVLAVPMYWWDLSRPEPLRQLAGCVYAHRVLGDAPFCQDDVDLVLDITRILQPSLNLLNHLDEVKQALLASRTELDDLRAKAAQKFDLGGYQSMDPWFAETILLPLNRLSNADKVGLLIMGASGSGKSHLARCYHYASPRKKKPFIVLDCSQITSAETLAAELFGYGPHSGFANAPAEGRPGKALLANGGTLFIDEIGCLPAVLQQQLLSLLERGCYTALGANTEISVDVQILSATNEDLPTLVKEGAFREDLYWRLGEIVIYMPALNQHPADIPHLANGFLEEARARYKREDVTSFSPAALSSLMKYNWAEAGNIRGLRYAINRSVLMAEAGQTELQPEDLQLQHQYSYQDGPSMVLGSAPSPTQLSPASSPTSTQPPSPPTQPSSAPSLTSTPSASTRPGLEPTGGLLATPPPALTGQPPEPAWETPETPQKAEEAEDPTLLFLKQKLDEYKGVLTELASDAEVATRLGYTDKIPYSSLRLRLKKLGLEEYTKQIKDRHQGPQADLSDVVNAIKQHGSGTAAAKSLGMTRDALIWKLRDAGLTIRGVLKSG